MATFTNPDTVHRASVGAIAPAAWGDTVNDDLNFLYGDTGWTAVSSFSNGWINYGSTYFNAAYRKVGTRILLRGMIKSGTSGAAAFTLPTGYRPLSFVRTGGDSNTGWANIVVDTGGGVTPTGGTSFVSLDIVAFDTI